MSVCRSCGHADLAPILSLGRTPLANALLTREQLHEPEPTFPLELVFCPGCSLVQITETVPPDQLFRDYPYLSSYSDTAVSNAKSIAHRMIDQLGLNSDSLATEVASNDGYLLQFYKEKGIPVLGIEPARNVAKVAREERGIPTVDEFFGLSVARRFRDSNVLADVVHANNVLAHVADLTGFVAGLATFIKDSGAIVIEAPYVRRLIEELEFDTIYHEHLCYFSLTALVELFRRAGLSVFDVEQLPIHGGSLRLVVRKAAYAAAVPSPAVERLLAEERDWGVGNLAAYTHFSTRVSQLCDELRSCLMRLKSQGARIAAYGASAKGSTLLNYLGVGTETLDYIVDRSPYKQGRYAPGTHLPIEPPAKLLEDKPDYVLLLTWNFADEILAQQDPYRRTGGRFIVPIPTVTVV